MCPNSQYFDDYYHVSNGMIYILLPNSLYEVTIKNCVLFILD